MFLLVLGRSGSAGVVGLADFQSDLELIWKGKYDLLPRTQGHSFDGRTWNRGGRGSRSGLLRRINPSGAICVRQR
jgi:hypothetical protein